VRDAEPLVRVHPHGALVLVTPPAPLALEGELAGERATPWRATLTDEEWALLCALVPGRRPTWWAGRTALAAALAAAGAPRTPLTSDHRGAPVVPAGYSGSISHKPSLACALAEPTDGAHVGVDVEHLEAPRVAIGKRVLTPAEQVVVGDDPVALMARFSIKESIYKAVDRFVGRYVAFPEAEILALPAAPPAASWAQATFVGVAATLTMSKGEGPFDVEATWARVGTVVVSTARVRPRAISPLAGPTSRP
jgi:4'-phosphopantetheinyl transferase EntD